MSLEDHIILKALVMLQDALSDVSRLEYVTSHPASIKSPGGKSAIHVDQDQQVLTNC
jgi:hypothetical protein